MLTQALLLELAEELRKVAFEQQREPRSEVYREGVKAALINQATGASVANQCPHPVGSVEFDAFHAGVSEGYAVWAEYTKTTGVER